MSVVGTLRSERQVAVPRQGPGAAPGITDSQPVGSEVSRGGDRVTARLQGDPRNLVEAGLDGTAATVEVVIDGHVVCHYPPQARMICAWCKVIMVDGPADLPETHAICPSCVERVSPK